MSVSPPKPVNRILAFLLGFAGFLAFAGLSIFVVMHYRNAGTGYEDARAKARQDWRAAAAAAQAGVHTSAWKDKAAGVATLAAADYLPIAAKSLVSPENAARPMTGDAHLVPGTPAFEAFSARQAAEAAAQQPAPPPAPDVHPAPGTPAVPVAPPAKPDADNGPATQTLPGAPQAPGAVPVR